MIADYIKKKKKMLKIVTPLQIFLKYNLFPDSRPKAYFIQNLYWSYTALHLDNCPIKTSLITDICTV